MSLQDLVNDFGKEQEYSIEEKNESKALADLLSEGKYNLLKQFLDDSNIFTTGDLKSLSEIKYNNLKSKVTSIAGVGEDKANLFFYKLDEIRKKRYIETSFELQNGNKNIDKQNKLNIEMKKIDLFKKILNFICFNIINKKRNNKTILKNKLKQNILKNEDKLLSVFGKDYGVKINLFKKNIEGLRYDGDIVKFINNSSLYDIKKDFYDLVKGKGYKTAIDIVNEYKKDNLTYTSISNLKVGEKINTMTLCALANNFNMTLGMYYNEKDDILILKSQMHNGYYDDKWINSNDILYCLQSEKKAKYQSLEFSNKPNQICRDIILRLNSSTKVYLFTREKKYEHYIFCGEVIPVKFLNNNKCILISIK